MLIYYSQDYLRKSSILNYPFTGYYYQFGFDKLDNDKSWSENYQEEYSDHYPCNTLIKKFDGSLRCKISILMDKKERDNPYKVIYISALDNTIYKDLEDLKLTDDHTKYFSQVAAIIRLDSSFSKDHTNIIDISYVPKCSFTIVDSGEQVIHYQNEGYNKSNFYKANNNQFIEFNSGNNKIKDLMATQYPNELDGHMTIRRSGSIHL